MLMTVETDIKFAPLLTHVNRIRQLIQSSAGAVYVIRHDKVVAEAYFGTHEHDPSSRDVQADSQFNLYSARKAYIGLAVGIAIHKGTIGSLDDEVSDYFPELNPVMLQGTKIRHLLTYSHGLYGLDNDISRIAPVGIKWAYNNTGIDLLPQLIKRTTGKTVAQLINKHIIQPLKLTETGWRTKSDAISKLVPETETPEDAPFWRLGSNDGSERNLYVSAREFAAFGYLHLKKGDVHGTRVLPSAIFDMTTSVQSPPDWKYPQHGFCWWMNENDCPESELGENVPSGSYQILGYTGCACLVIPELDAVAVRMYNRLGSPLDYDYLRDIKDFGNLVVECLTK